METKPSFNFKLGQYITNALDLDFSKAGLASSVKKFFSSLFKTFLAVALAAGLGAALSHVDAYLVMISGKESESLVLMVMVIRALISSAVDWANTKKAEVVENVG